MSAIQDAIRSGDLVRVQSLLETSSVQIKADPDLLVLAAKFAPSDVLDLLLQSGARENLNSSLYQLMTQNNLVTYSRTGMRVENLIHPVELVRIFLAKGMDPNRLNPDGGTFLHMAVNRGIPDLASVLLAAGANPNMADIRGETPVVLAVQRGDREILLMLLAEGGDANLPTRNGSTAMQQAAQRGRRDLIELLIEYGALPEFKDLLDKTTPRHARKPEITQDVFIEKEKRLCVIPKKQELPAKPMRWEMALFCNPNAGKGRLSYVLYTVIALGLAYLFTHLLKL